MTEGGCIQKQKKGKYKQGSRSEIALQKQQVSQGRNMGCMQQSQQEYDNLQG
jgi:hypothetical protein